MPHPNEMDELQLRTDRHRQTRGILKLQKAFGIDPDDPWWGWRVMKIMQSPLLRAPDFDPTPVRLHPNTPPIRDAEHQRKHERRKVVRASRRANRK